MAMDDNIEQLTTQQALDILLSLGSKNRRGDAVWVNCANKNEEAYVANLGRQKLREGHVR